MCLHQCINGDFFLPVHSTGLGAVGGSDHHWSDAGQHGQEVPPTNGLPGLCNQEVLWQERNVIGSLWGWVHWLAVPPVNNLYPASLRRKVKSFTCSAALFFCCFFFFCCHAWWSIRLESRQLQEHKYSTTPLGVWTNIQPNGRKKKIEELEWMMCH